MLKFINIQENNYINRIKDLSKWNLIMGDYKFNLWKLPQIQIVWSNLKAKHHGRNTLSPQPKARLFLCIEKDENNSENTLDIINQELLDKDQFRSNIIWSKDNMKVNRDLLTRLMSRYTQKRSPFQEYKEMTNNKFSQINTSLPRKSEKKEEQKYKLISSFQPKVKDLSGRTKCHPRIRLLNRREIEIRTKILSTIMSEGDLNSIK